MRPNSTPTTYQKILMFELSKKPAVAVHLLTKSNFSRKPPQQLDGTLLDHDDDEFSVSSLAPSKPLSWRLGIFSVITQRWNTSMTFKRTTSSVPSLIFVALTLTSTGLHSTNIQSFFFSRYLHRYTPL